MAARSLTCPNCGGPVQVESAYTTLTVCPYCNSSLIIRDTGVDITGKVAKLAQFPSRLALGKAGAVRGRPFRTLGRIRYQYADGFWDEWNVQFQDGQVGWLEEDEGEFTLVYKRKLTSALPPFAQVAVGHTIPLGGEGMFVSEKGQATAVGAEGELIATTAPGRAIHYIDGNASGKAIRLLVDDNGITLHQGEPLDFAELQTQ
jgi:hypothetical protein